MSSIVSCKGHFVWKYNAGVDDSFLGMKSVMEATGVGKVLNVTFDSEKTNSYGELAWKEVHDPRKEPVEGEVMFIEPEEVAVIRKYVKSNIPEQTFLQRIMNKSPQVNSLNEMIISTMKHLSDSERNEVVFVW